MSLRQQSLALIEQKLVPELEADLQLPLFVCIVGGTNTGKSTRFNALAGVILSESKVTASATKHPLVYAHKCWEDTTMNGRLFSAPKRLESPGQLLMKSDSDETFMTFHDRQELKDIAFIDAHLLPPPTAENRDAAPPERAPNAVERMAAVQARYEAGELPVDLYDPPFQVD